LKDGEFVMISKAAVPVLPSVYDETFLGTPPGLAHPGAFRQYRDRGRIHVYETIRHWIPHRDSVDPRKDPVMHLVLDAPEVLGGVITGLVVGGIAAYKTRSHKLRKGDSESDANAAAIWTGVAIGVLAGAVAYFLIGAAKKASR